ncbi:MAG: mycothiol system anti-sigma-R factor [Actinomycetota bacterium]
MNEITDCDEVLQDIQLYIDGEVTPERAQRLAAHFEGCPPCLHRAEFQAKLKDVVRSKCRLEAPDHLVLKIRRIIRSRSAP